MKLRAFQKEDSAVICSWVKDEKSVYQWSADRIAQFPLDDDALNRHYELAHSRERIIPLTAVDESDRVAGHLFIRYPNREDESTVRFGCIIVDPALRGQGAGKALVNLAVDYARTVLGASVVTLAVFDNNPGARHCYEAVGFRAARKVTYKMPIGEWECTEMELTAD